MERGDLGRQNLAFIGTQGTLGKRARRKSPSTSMVHAVGKIMPDSLSIVSLLRPQPNI